MISNQVDAEAELLPCPFCGKPARFKFPYEPENGVFGDSGVWVECSDQDACGCQVGQYGMNSHEDECGNFSTFNEAIKAWNRRV